MAISLLPDRVYGTLDQIDWESLAGSGLRLLLADLDNTISPYSVFEPTEAVFAWKARLERCGIRLFVLSNNRSKTRTKHYCRLLQVPYIHHAGKPRAASFCKAMEQMGCSREETLMVGDQVFTDVCGAKNAGIAVYLVKPICIRDNPLRALRHGIQQPFIWAARLRTAACRFKQMRIQNKETQKEGNI